MIIRGGFMKKALVFVLTALIIATCTNTSGGDRSESRTFYRAEKIGEIEEPICKYPNDDNEEGAYAPTSIGYYFLHQESDREKWILHFGDNYGDDIYIGQEQPADCDTIDEIPENPFDLEWVDKWFIPDGSGGHGWPYDPYLIREVNLTSSAQLNYVAFKANIYQWKLTTE
jgi:hypothetical protein